MDIVLENIIIGKADTTANWTSDATIYSLGFMMISSDATYSGTNVKKLKIANGVDTWTNIDFVPVAETLAQILLKDNKTGGEPIHSDDEYSVLKVLNNEIALFIDDGATGGANFLGDYTRAKMRFVEYATFKTGEINIDILRTYIKHSDLIELTAPSVKINNDEALAYKWYNDVNANSNGIINLRDAVAPQEPITKSQFDSYNASVGRQRGAIDCSANPNYPASNVGDRWEVTVAGKIGGASGIDVQVYDEIVCKTQSVAGDQATVGANFYVIQGNVERASESVGGYVQLATDVEVQGGTENTKAFTSLKLENWWVNIKTLAHTFAAKITFTSAPRFNSTTASQRLEVDSNKDLISVAKGTADNKDFGTGSGTVCEGNDYRLPYLVSDTTRYTNTGNITENVITYLLITGGKLTNKVFEVYINTILNNTANNRTFKMYFNSTPNLAGTPVLAATYTANTAGGRFSRKFKDLGTTIKNYIATGTSFSNYEASTTQTATENTLAVDLTTNKYLVITAQNTVAGDSAIVDFCYIKSIT